MSFEMSLPHPPRIQHLAADGGEQLATQEQQWHLYYTVQQALQQEEAGAEKAEAGGAASDRAKAAAQQPSDPQLVLNKLQSARGELDVVTDLITFVEQQQFLSVEGIHRPPASLEERLRARSLRLAAAKRALRGAAGALAAGLEALRARAQLDDRFLADLARLRRRWRLRRHSGTAGLFYVDISLPLRGVAQEGAQCLLIQDTNGDACLVEQTAGGKRRALRGWRAIHALLEAKQRLLAWRVLQQLLAAAARLPRHEADPNCAVAAVQRLAAAAAAASQAAAHAAVAGGGVAGAGGGEAAAMDVDGLPGAEAGGQEQQLCAAVAAAREAHGGAAAGPCVLDDSMLSSAARDIQAALPLPGCHQRFEARALLLLSRLLAGGGGGPATSQQQQQAREAVLEGLVQWLQHEALSERVAAALRRWRAAAPGRGLRPVDSGEDFAAVWQLMSDGGAVQQAVPPLLVVVQSGGVRLEGGGAAAAALLPAAAAQRGLSCLELERLLQSL